MFKHDGGPMANSQRTARLVFRSMTTTMIFLVCAISSLSIARSAWAHESASASGAVSGTVDDVLAHPIAGTRVILLDAQGKVVAAAVSDPRGRLRFERLPAGAYQVHADKPGYQNVVAGVVVSDASPAAPLALTMASRTPLTLAVTAAKFDAARNALSPETGSSAYRFDQPTIVKLPLGANTPMSQLLAQAPGVTPDAYGQGQGQIHIHGENGGGIQYRLNGVFLPDAVSSYGEIFSPRFVRSLTLLTGVLPAQFGFRNEDVVDIHTKDGCTDGGPANSNVELYGGQRGTFEPSFELGGCAGRLSFYAAGSYLQSTLGLQSPTASPDPRHDQTYQGEGLANLSYLIDARTRLSLLSGIVVNSFQIPPEPGLTPVAMLKGVTDFPSIDITDRELEQSYYTIVALQGTLAANIDYQLAAFSRYYSLDFYPDPEGDLIYNGVAARIFHSGFISGLQEDTSYHLNLQHSLRGGFYLSGETIELDDHARTFPASDGVQTSSTPVLVVDNHHQIIWVLGLYAQDEWRPVRNLVVNFGARWDWVAAFVTQNQLSPRVAIEYTVRRGTLIHAGYARYFKVPPFEWSRSKRSGNSPIPPTPRRSEAAMTRSRPNATTTLIWVCASVYSKD
jgi:outer membrane receptor protein involved in Fe transport